MRRQCTVREASKLAVTTRRAINRAQRALNQELWLLWYKPRGTNVKPWRSEDPVTLAPGILLMIAMAMSKAGLGPQPR